MKRSWTGNGSGWGQIYGRFSSLISLTFYHLQALFIFFSACLHAFTSHVNRKNIPLISFSRTLQQKYVHHILHYVFQISLQLLQLWKNIAVCYHDFAASDDTELSLTVWWRGNFGFSPGIPLFKLWWWWKWYALKKCNCGSFLADTAAFASAATSVVALTVFLFFFTRTRSHFTSLIRPISYICFCFVHLHLQYLFQFVKLSRVYWKMVELWLLPSTLSSFNL